MNIDEKKNKSSVGKCGKDDCINKINIDNECINEDTCEIDLSEGDNAVVNDIIIVGK